MHQRYTRRGGSAVSNWQCPIIQQHWKTGGAGTLHEIREYRATRAMYSPGREHRNQLTTPENPAPPENGSPVSNWQRHKIQQRWKNRPRRNCPRNTGDNVRQGRCARRHGSTVSNWPRQQIQQRRKTAAPQATGSTTKSAALESRQRLAFFTHPLCVLPPIYCRYILLIYQVYRLGWRRLATTLYNMPLTT